MDRGLKILTISIKQAIKIAGYFVLSALGVLLVSFVSWAVVKVVLNVSNNLHEINAKM